MATRLVTVTRFLTAAEADLACAVLESEGIRCFPQDSTTLQWFWYWSYAAGGVKLQVAEEDAAPAREILSRRAPAAAEETAAAAACAQCGSQAEPGFDTCWSCGADLTSQGITASAETGSRTVPLAHELPSETAEARVTRAWRAAIIGLLACPPLLNLYSLWILLGVAWDNPPLSPSDNRKFYLALLVDLVACSLAAWFLLHSFTS